MTRYWSIFPSRPCCPFKAFFFVFFLFPNGIPIYNGPLGVERLILKLKDVLSCPPIQTIYPVSLSHSRSLPCSPSLLFFPIHSSLTHFQLVYASAICSHPQSVWFERERERDERHIVSAVLRAHLSFLILFSRLPWAGP